MYPYAQFRAFLLVGVQVMTPLRALSLYLGAAQVEHFAREIHQNHIPLISRHDFAKNMRLTCHEIHQNHLTLISWCSFAKNRRLTCHERHQSLLTLISRHDFAKNRRLYASLHPRHSCSGAQMLCLQLLMQSACTFFLAGKMHNRVIYCGLAASGTHSTAAKRNPALCNIIIVRLPISDNRRRRYIPMDLRRQNGPKMRPEVQTNVPPATVI